MYSTVGILHAFGFGFHDSVAPWLIIKILRKILAMLTFTGTYKIQLTVIVPDLSIVIT